MPAGRLGCRHSTFQDDKQLYMLLEYVPGGELFRHLRHVQRFKLEYARFYIGCVVLALEYLHSKDIIYRWTAAALCSVCCFRARGLLGPKVAWLPL
jgi:Protein kinase domain